MSGPSVFGPNPYVSKSPVAGRIVTVLRGLTDRRGLYLTTHRSRAIPAGQIHELMITDEDAGLEAMVDRVGLIGFFEVTDGGVILVNDHVVIGERHLGVVAGFDETHMPNHQNICVRGTLTDGESLAIALGEQVRIERT